MIQPTLSLVKYDNPVLVSRTDGTKTQPKPGASPATATTGDKGSGNKINVKKLPPVDDKGRVKTPTQTEDILNSILPPR